MIELLLVIAIMGLLYYAFVLNNVGPVRAQATTTSANALQAQIESAYGAWTALGGTHNATFMQRINYQGAFAYDVLFVLTQSTGTNSPTPPYYSVTHVADSSAALTPASNIVRLQLAGALSDPGINGTQGLIYGPFYILAKPTSTSSAIWSVTSTIPTTPL
jgi:type II secretory pathway pseudopilin PulG